MTGDENPWVFFWFTVLAIGIIVVIAIINHMLLMAGSIG